MRQMTGVRMHGKGCLTYCTSTCRMQLFRSVELLLVKLAVQHISRMHFEKNISQYIGKWEQLQWNSLLPSLRWQILTSNGQGQLLHHSSSLSSFQPQNNSAVLMCPSVILLKSICTETHQFPILLIFFCLSNILHHLVPWMN